MLSRISRFLGTKKKLSMNIYHFYYAFSFLDSGAKICDVDGMGHGRTAWGVSGGDARAAGPSRRGAVVSFSSVHGR